MWGGGSAADLAGSERGCCVAAPSPVTSLSLIGGVVITLLCVCGVPGKAPERGRMRLPEQLPFSVSPSLLLRLSSRAAGPVVPAGPGGYNTRPISSILLILQ